MSPFANDVILITGASSGVGAALARRLAAEGAAVGAIGRNRDALDALGDELGGNRYAAAIADVADRDAVAAAVRELETKLGPADRLILSAGIARVMPAREFSAEG